MKKLILMVIMAVFFVGCAYGSSLRHRGSMLYKTNIIEVNKAWEEQRILLTQLAEIESGFTFQFKKMEIVLTKNQKIAIVATEMYFSKAGPDDMSLGGLVYFIFTKAEDTWRMIRSVTIPQ